MRIVFGADHAGFDMKQDVLAFVRGLGHEVLDVGAFTGTQPCLLFDGHSLSERTDSSLSLPFCLIMLDQNNIYCFSL
jgi:hypothetical protein